jgi:hypothetical protein
MIVGLAFFNFGTIPRGIFVLRPYVGNINISWIWKTISQTNTLPSKLNCIICKCCYMHDMLVHWHAHDRQHCPAYNTYYIDPFTERKIYDFDIRCIPPYHYECKAWYCIIAGARFFLPVCYSSFDLWPSLCTPHPFGVCTTCQFFMLIDTLWVPRGRSRLVPVVVVG